MHHTLVQVEGCLHVIRQIESTLKASGVPHADDPSSWSPDVNNTLIGKATVSPLVLSWKFVRVEDRDVPECLPTHLVRTTPTPTDHPRVSVLFSVLTTTPEGVISGLIELRYFPMQEGLWTASAVKSDHLFREIPSLDAFQQDVRSGLMNLKRGLEFVAACGAEYAQRKHATSPVFLN